MISDIFLADSQETGSNAIFAVGPIVRVRNGDRTNLSSIDHSAVGVTFASTTIANADTGTISRGCRGFADIG